MLWQYVTDNNNNDNTNNFERGVTTKVIGTLQSCSVDGMGDDASVL